MEVILHPLVDNDLLEAMNYYEREVGGELALEFYTEFRRCVGVVQRRGTSLPYYVGQLRRLNFDRFPFHILFEVISDELIQIVTVKHDSRHPSIGLER